MLSAKLEVSYCHDNKFPIRNSDLVPLGTDLVEHSHDVHPVDDPIWRGCFNVLNEKYELGGVVAHLSVKACQKANVDDIELFFFPSEARHMEIFDHLVEDMIGGVYALRALMPYGEVLVFTSTELPLPH
ncbi:hypothetical protein MTR67_035171 [Solanum verrucosum]|uniref:AIPP2-like SPOC-like domain-containing protein n=1 Tax=Solanum verrucosum TaxID=315347 RepID=A0AAF0U9X4_SOLVR|nr:hypothetical protein MTR67_035171 [Solanum verrucosum]